MFHQGASGQRPAGSYAPARRCAIGAAVKLAGVVRLPVSEHQIEKRDHGEIEENVASSPRGSIRSGNAQGACAAVESEGGFGELSNAVT